MKTLRYLAEAALLYLCFGLFRLLGLNTASALGGWLGRTIGPRLAASRKALSNIAQAFPGKDAQAHQKILCQMWDNLGRVMAEYPHIKLITAHHVTYEGLDHLENLESTAVLFSAHLANWEIISPALNAKLSNTMRSLYREPNNPYSRILLEKARETGGHIDNIPKSKTGVRDMVRVLKEGGRLGVLIDQKYNQGEAVPFFDRPAMTSPAFVQLVQKFSCPLIPVQIERTQGPHFKMTVHPPLKIDEKNEYEAIEAAHHLLEAWIRQHPGQWLWLHRRWDSAALKGETDE